MTTALPLSAGPRMTLRLSARFGWLMLRERYLMRRMQRATLRQKRVDTAAGGGRLLHFTRKWLACHAEIAVLIGEPEREDAAEVRAILARRSPGGLIIEAHPACTPDRAAAGPADMLATRLSGKPSL